MTDHEAEAALRQHAVVTLRDLADQVESGRARVDVFHEGAGREEASAIDNLLNELRGSIDAGVLQPGHWQAIRNFGQRCGQLRVAPGDGRRELTVVYLPVQEQGA